MADPNTKEPKPAMDGPTTFLEHALKRANDQNRELQKTLSDLRHHLRHTEDIAHYSKQIRDMFVAVFDQMGWKLPPSVTDPFGKNKGG